LQSSLKTLTLRFEHSSNNWTDLMKLFQYPQQSSFLLQGCSITYLYFNIADFTRLSENAKNVLRKFPKLWWTWVRKAIKEKNWSKTRNNIWQSSKSNYSLMSSCGTLNEIESNNYLDIWHISKNKTDLKNWNERKKWNNDDSEKERKKERERESKIRMKES